jgi:hypothetical protein
VFHKSNLRKLFSHVMNLVSQIGHSLFKNWVSCFPEFDALSHMKLTQILEGTIETIMHISANNWPTSL